jgi:hypothetical protein
MNGLDQIFENEIQPMWVDKYGLNDSLIVITDKFDGVSCMLVFADKDGDGHMLNFRLRILAETVRRR